MNRIARWITLNAGIALCYLLLGKLGLALALPPGYVSAIWPAAGFAFAATLVWGAKATWPGILLSATVTNATIGGGFHLDTAAVCIGMGSTLQAIVGGSYLKRLMPDLELSDPRKVLRFSLISIASCLIAATVGNLTLLAHGYISTPQLLQSFVTWWLGDAFGVQIFAPLSLVLLAPGARWKQRRVSVGLPLLAAFLMSGVIYYFVRESDERQLQRDFAAATAPFTHELRSLERHNGQALRQLAAGYSVGNQEPGPEFEPLAAEIYKTLPAMRAISWTPVLDAAGQAAYGKKNQTHAAPVRWPAGFIPAADGLVAPVAMVYPRQGNEAALGMDILGEPQRAQALRQALASGQLTMTSRLRLEQDPDGPGAVLLMAPVQNSVTRGVVSGVVDLRLIDQALQATPGTVWELREVSATGEQLMWRSSAVTMPAFAGATYLDRLGVYSQQTLKLGGREWHLL
ncbi:MAG: MASE1 domain-containing protein, partial [Pseudomonadota bacterium]